MSHNAHKFAAGLIIYRSFNKSFEYLLLQTSYGVHHWTPPKGHLDPGENDLQAAIRETQEEAGLNPSDYIIDTKFKHVMNYNAAGSPKTVTYLLAKVKQPAVPIRLSDEHQKYEWLSLGDAIRLTQYEEMIAALQAADSHIAAHDTNGQMS